MVKMPNGMTIVYTTLLSLQGLVRLYQLARVCNACLLEAASASVRLCQKRSNNSFCLMARMTTLIIGSFRSVAEESY